MSFAFIFLRRSCTGKDLITSCERGNTVCRTADPFIRVFSAVDPLRRGKLFSKEIMLPFPFDFPSALLQRAHNVCCRLMLGGCSSGDVGEVNFLFQTPPLSSPRAVKTFPSYTWQRCVFSVNWENPQKSVGFSSLFTLRLDFLPDSVVFQLSLFGNTVSFWGRMSAETLFGFPPRWKWCFPRCFLCRCPFYCMSVQCFPGNPSVCDSGFWRRRCYSIWQLSVWGACFLLAIVNKPCERSSSCRQDEHWERPLPDCF